ncbi:MAG: hypothetical protein FWC50_10760, partial [Planctomycetaceae bacterium]|nr:hypothetical protein [Planctomycetaceae bacterium]
MAKKVTGNRRGNRDSRGSGSSPRGGGGRTGGKMTSARPGPKPIAPRRSPVSEAAFENGDLADGESLYYGEGALELHP